MVLLLLLGILIVFFSGYHFEAGSINTLQIVWFYRKTLDSKNGLAWSPKASAFAKAPKAEALDSNPFF